MHADTSTNNNGWTPERRARQSAAIRKWSPWTNSTGPRTKAGKARVARNAAKDWTGPKLAIKLALVTHEFYLAEINRLLRLKKENPKNKLLARRIRYREKALIKQSRDVTKGLAGVVLAMGICKNLAFRPPIPIKVNAK